MLLSEKRFVGVGLLIPAPPPARKFRRKKSVKKYTQKSLAEFN
jgi:hypothetical protein